MANLTYVYMQSLCYRYLNDNCDITHTSLWSGIYGLRAQLHLRGVPVERGDERRALEH